MQNNHLKHYLYRLITIYLYLLRCSRSIRGREGLSRGMMLGQRVSDGANFFCIPKDTSKSSDQGGKSAACSIKAPVTPVGSLYQYQYMLQSASVYAYGADTIETINIFKSVKNVVLSLMIQCYNNIWVYESIYLTKQLHYCQRQWTQEVRIPNILSHVTMKNESDFFFQFNYVILFIALW